MHRVIIIFRHVFSFSQDWNRTFLSLKEHFEWFATLSEISVQDLSRMKEVAGSVDARKAFKFLVEIALLSWNTRIWTAQEYVLARILVWIDGHNKRIELGAEDMITLNRFIINGGG